MDPVKIILYIAAAILIFFGVLFIWGAFSDTGSIGWIPVGIISVAIGFVLIWFGSQRAKQADAEAKIKVLKERIAGLK